MKGYTMKLQDNQVLEVSATIQLNQKDIDFLFNGWNDVKEPTLQQVIEKAVYHLNKGRSVEVNVKSDAKGRVYTDGEGDIQASMELAGY